MKTKSFITLIVLLVIAVVLVLFLNWRGQKPGVVAIHQEPSNSQNTDIIQLCFQKKLTSPSNMTDVYSLRMSLAGEQVAGELRMIPAEKDSKTGIFTGSVTAVNPQTMSRTISALWQTEAEGMSATEELSIIFGEGTASVGFGEMKDNGDGTYVYANPSEIAYTLELSDADCATLE